MHSRIAAAAAFLIGFALGTARRRQGRLQLVGTTAARTTARAPRLAKVRAVVVLGAVRARDAVGVLLGWRDGEEATDALVIEMTGEVASAINARSLAG